jgi:uncharacterized protein YcbX
MERHLIGTIKELYRYPVKSLLGERLNQFDMATEGVIGDRAWALIGKSRRARDDGQEIPRDARPACGL